MIAAMRCGVQGPSLSNVSENALPVALKLASEETPLIPCLADSVQLCSHRVAKADDREQPVTVKVSDSQLKPCATLFSVAARLVASHRLEASAALAWRLTSRFVCGYGCGGAPPVRTQRRPRMRPTLADPRHPQPRDQPALHCRTAGSRLRRRGAEGHGSQEIRVKSCDLTLRRLVFARGGPAARLVQ